MLKNQLFGVEVEMTGITREKAARLVAGVLGTTPSHPESNCYHTRTIADQAARKWKIMVHMFLFYYGILNQKTRKD